MKKLYMEILLYNQKNIFQLKESGMDLKSKKNKENKTGIRYKCVAKSHSLKTYMNELNPGTISLVFEGNLTIHNINDLRQSLLHYLNIYKSVHIVLSKVEKIDTAGFQILYYAKQWAQQNLKQIIFRSPSEQVKKITDLYNYSLGKGE